MFYFATISMHASPLANWIYVFVLAFSYKFLLFKFAVKDADRAQNASANPGPVQA